MLTLSRWPRTSFLIACFILSTTPASLLAETEKSSENDANVKVVYNSDFLSNINGGKESGSAYVDFATIEFRHQIDFAKEQKLDLFVSGMYANGADFSTTKSGDIQGTSGIETGINLKRVHEAYVQFSNKSHSILLGLYDTNTEFDVLDSANLFVNAAYGMGNTLGSSGTNGPSTYPFPGLSIRYQYTKADLLLRTVITDGVPGDRQHPDSPGLNLSTSEGYLSIVELDYSRKSTKWLFGAWRYSKNTLRDDLPNKQSNTGLYLRVEHQFQMFDGLTGFARLGTGNEQFNAFSRFYSAGLVKTGLLSTRPNDALGVAFAYAEGSSEFDFTENMTELAKGELNIELTYQIKVTDYFSLQPTFQLIDKPSRRKSAKVHVIGLRTILSF